MNLICGMRGLLEKASDVTRPYSGFRIGRRAFFATFTLGLALFFAPASWAVVDQDEAKVYLDKLGNDAISALSSDAGSEGDRERQVQELLRTNLDLEIMGRFVLGPNWRKATPEEREEYSALFADFVVITYARRLGGYDGQQFRVVGTSAAGKADALVVTEILGEGQPPIKAGWRVREQKDGSLKIVDVLVEGVSMLQTQRADFEGVLRSSGLEGLNKLLREKIESLPKS